MAQAPSYTNLYLNHNQKMMEEQFPTSPGGRYHTFITNKGDDDEYITEFNVKGILTLLIEDKVDKKKKLYSLSIKLETADTADTVKELKIKFNGAKYVFDKEKKNCYKIDDESNDKLDDKKVSHILIIGIIPNNSAPEDKKVFNITKTYLIINDEIKGIAKYTEGVSSEEYLNLYYIEHFSLDIKEFMEIYNKYKEQVTDIDDMERTGLSDAETKAKGVLEETNEDTLNDFNDDKSNYESEEIRSREDSPGAGEPATVGQGTGVPVAGDKGNGEIAGVPGSISQGGGKKLASKVKKIKNKKNKVV